MEIFSFLITFVYIKLLGTSTFLNVFTLNRLPYFLGLRANIKMTEIVHI